jgi:hypothetical protein
MTTTTTIRYTFCVEKQIDWAKSWVKYYAPALTNEDVDKVFVSKHFTSKYSSTPPKGKTVEDIKNEASEDLKDYLDKVRKRIYALKGIRDHHRDKIIEKVMEELPTEGELFDILMSYRIYNTEGKTRIRRPSRVVVNVEKLKENNNNVNNKNNK